MVMSMFGRVEETIPDELALACPRLVEKLLRYQSQCLLYGTMNIGYMPGTLFHYYHGEKRKRFYNERVRILIEEEFNPDEDLFYNKYGVIELRGNKPRLRDKMRDYFRSRNEDHNP